MKRRAPIAALNRRLALEAPVDTMDDAGALQRDWTLVAQVYGAIRTLAGRETFEAQRPRYERLGLVERRLPASQEVAA